MALTVTQLFGKKNIAVKLPVNKIAAGGAGWNTWRAHNFPGDKIFLVEAMRVNDHMSQLIYNDHFRNQKVHVNVPNTFEVDIDVEEEDQKDLFAKYQKSLIADLPYNLNHYFSIGSDPEIFVEDGDGNIIPAFEFLGSKENPNFTAEGDYGSNPMYWDGFQAEFVTAAEHCLAWQVDSTQLGLRGVIWAAREKFPNARLSAKTVFDLDSDMIRSAKEEHVQFGCMPSFNAYGITGHMRNGRDVMFRPAGGHIHYGIGTTTHEQAIPIVKALDMILGVACVSLFANFDDPKRRTMYGLPGEYRLPAHGLEYRTLSNAWLVHPLIMNLVFDISRKCVIFGKQKLHSFWDATEEETIKTITTCDVEKAREILRRNEQLFKKIIEAAYREYDSVVYDTIFNIFIEGLESAIENPYDIEGNWNVDDDWVTHSDGKGKNLVMSIDMLLDGEKV